jgi:hypothetical protein
MRSNFSSLEAGTARCRAALEQAEPALEQANRREPQIGDFVESTLTKFYGRVTKVTPRAEGRSPWLEITPYLTAELPGRGTMDLYDHWEVIDPPAVER